MHTLTHTHTQQGSPPRHMAELDGNPQDSGGVGPNSSLKKRCRLRFCYLNATNLAQVFLLFQFIGVKMSLILL